MNKLQQLRKEIVERHERQLAYIDSQLSRTCRSDAMFSEHGVDPCS